MQKTKIAFFLLSLSAGMLYAQYTRNAEAPQPPRPQYQAFKREKISIFSIVKKEKKAEARTQAEEQAEFRKRVMRSTRESYKADAKANKLKRKEAKSGQLFLGHKRPPKKRPPGKQKFCKVCRIKH